MKNLDINTIILFLLLCLCIFLVVSSKLKSEGIRLMPVSMEYTADPVLFDFKKM